MYLKTAACRFTITCITILMLVAAPSCKKPLEQKYDDIMKQLMTDGSWVITNFTENNVDITPSFNAWVCKFYDNNTLVATQGTTTQAGTWQSDASSKTVSAQFNYGTGDPLQKINGTWTIVSTLPTVGKFTQTKGGIVYTMELTKY